MLKSFVYTFIIILLITIQTKAQVTEIFKLPRKNHIPLILSYYKIGLDSISNIKITDSLRSETKRLNEDLEIWYVDLCFNNMNSYYGEKHSGAPNILISKEQYFLNSPHPEIPIAYYYFLAQSYIRLKNVDKAYHYFFKVEDMLKELGYDKVALTHIILVNLADFYAAFEDYNQSINYIQLGLKYANNQLFQKQNSQMLNNYGVYLLKLKKYEEAEKVFLQVIEESKKDKENYYEGIGASNIGNIKRIQGKYKEALPYLYKDLEINETNVKENVATSCLYLAHCLIELDSIAKAKTYIEKAKTLASQSFYQSSFFPTYYEVAALYYLNIRDFKKVNEMKDALIYLKDSLKTLFDANTLRFTSLKEKEIKFNEQEKLVKSKAVDSVRLRNFIIVISLVLFFLIYYALGQKYKKEKLKANQKAQENLRKIDLANEKLKNFIDQIEEKNRVIEQYQDLRSNTAETAQTVPFIQNLLQSVILTDDDWEKFREIFNQAYPDFLQKLFIDYPNLSPAEIRLLVLQQLNISTKHQASILGISSASLRTAKYRLRKKYPMLLVDNESS